MDAPQRLTKDIHHATVTHNKTVSAELNTTNDVNIHFDRIVDQLNSNQR